MNRFIKRLLLVAALGGALGLATPARANCGGIFYEFGACGSLASLDTGSVLLSLGVGALAIGAVFDVASSWQEAPVWPVAEIAVAATSIIVFGVIAATGIPRLVLMVPIFVIDLALLGHAIFRLSNPIEPEAEKPMPVAGDAFFRLVPRQPMALTG